MSKISDDFEGTLISDFHKLYLKKGLTQEIVKLFQKIIYSYYKNHRRDFPFRNKINPYHVLVSEVMLQQTRTEAVSEKYLKFVNLFPDFLSLSQTSLEEVLKAWHGLGYNRRAIALKRIAEMVINDYKGNLPDSVDELKAFPQIGSNTASSIVAFAFNKPTIFVETNIRRVYIYFFFPQKNNVNDKEILPLVEKTLDKSNPREWYYALMDYGVMLKKFHPELNKKSAHYRRQAPFKGSNRQIRGEILKLLLNKDSLDVLEIGKILNVKAQKIKEILNQLEREGFIERKENTIAISKRTF